MPLEQLSNAVRFRAAYIASKLGATGLTVTVDVYNPAGTKIITAAAATEIGDGIYEYVLASGSVTTEGEYTAVFKTATTTVDQRHIFAQWTVGRAGVENLDATTSSRSTLTAAQVDTQLSGTHGSGSWEDAAVPAGTYQFVSVVVGDTITAKRGDRWVITLTVGALTGQTQVWFTVKKTKKDPDSRAVVQITRTGGLIRSNGSPATSGNGSLTINTESTGDITIVVEEAETDDYPDFTDGWWDVQMLDVNGTTTKAEGVFKITEDVTRAIA